MRFAQARQRPQFAGSSMQQKISALLQKATANHRDGQLAKAAELYRRILRLNPSHAGALHLLSLVVLQAGEPLQALELIDHSLKILPCDASACNSRGAILMNLGRLEEALKSFSQAIDLRPDMMIAYQHRGEVLFDLRRFNEALASFDRAIALDPDQAIAHNGRANALQELKQFQSAIESYDRAILLKPDYAAAYCNRGAALTMLKRYPESIDSLNRAIAIVPDYAAAYNNRANANLETGNCREAVRDFSRVLEIKPEFEYVEGMRLFARRQLCDWENIEAQERLLNEHIQEGKRVCRPFDGLAIVASAALQRKVAEIHASQRYPSAIGNAPFAIRSAHQRIRVGYFSSDFRGHAIGFLTANLFEQHDRRRFEIIGFSFGREADDPTRRRIIAAMDRFIDVRPLSDAEVTRMARDLELDIAVDLNGFTLDCRTGIFAGRTAPIQIDYLGYPGSMGADYYDYLIADRTLIPPEYRPHYSEKIVYMPDCFQCSDSSSEQPSATPTRAAENLPEEAFVYCCFNSRFKFSPSIFALWMRILARVEGSVLWIAERHPDTMANLRREAARHGIAPERLVFAERVLLPQHMARQRLADLFLDTLPFNACTYADG